MTNASVVSSQSGFGNARDFADSPIGYIDFGNFNLPQTEGTVEAWVRPDPRPTTGCDHAHFFAKGTDGHSGNGFTFYIRIYNDGSMDAGTGVTGGNVQALHSSAGTITFDGTWQHFAFTWSSEGSHLFVNGVLVDSGIPIMVGQTNQTVSLGKWGDLLYPDCRYLGEVDELRISSIARQLPQPPMQSGLVAYYPFNGNANDESGLGNHATVAGSVEYSCSRFGEIQGALNAAALSGFVTASTSQFSFGSEDRTISLWVFANDYAQPNTFLAGWGQPGVVDAMSAMVFGLGNVPSGEPGFWGWGDDFESSIGIANNEWHHIVFTLENSLGRIFVDGQLMASQALSLNTPPGTLLHIGNFTNTMGRFEGLIDDVRIYDSAISESEIAELFEEGEWPANCGSDPPTACTQEIHVDSRNDAFLLSHIGGLVPDEEYTVSVSAPGPVDAPMQGVFFMYLNYAGQTLFNYTSIGSSFTFRPSDVYGGTFQIAPIYVDWATTADNSGTIDIDITGPTSYHMSIDVRDDAVLLTNDIVSGLEAGVPHIVELSTDDIIHAPMQGMFFMYAENTGNTGFNYVDLGDSFTFVPANSAFQLAPIYVDWSTVQDNSGVLDVCITEDTLAPPAPGNVVGTVFAGSEGFAGVTITLLDAEGLPIPGYDPLSSDQNGSYAFSDLPSGEYQVMIMEPLGYTSDFATQATSLNPGETDILNFVLTESVIANDARSKGYWKHQFNVYVNGKGNAQESSANLTSYIATVHSNYTPHFGIFLGALEFIDWQGLLSVKGNAGMLEKAKEQLAALVLNVASLKIGQYWVVTEDGRTVGDVLTYVSELVIDGVSGNDELAKDLAESVNTQQVIGAGVVPEGNVLYRTGGEDGSSVPFRFALLQNYPNPFNPVTTIEYELPLDSHVSLRVYDVLGKEVATLVDGQEQAGPRSVTFDAADLASGVYLYQLKVGNHVATRRLVLLK